MAISKVNLQMSHTGAHRDAATKQKTAALPDCRFLIDLRNQESDSFFHDIREEVDDAVGVAPLVVIPAHEFEERGVQLDGGTGIEDG